MGNENISDYGLDCILSKVLKKRHYLNGADLKFLKKFPFKKMHLGSKERSCDVVFDEGILKNGVEFEAEMVISSNDAKEYLKVEEEDFFPDWVNEKIRLTKEYHNKKKKLIFSDIPKDKMEVVDYFNERDEQFLVFVDKNFINFNGNIYISRNDESSEIFVYCNKEDCKTLRRLPSISDYFGSFIYYDDCNCDSYETQKMDFVKDFEYNMDEIFPRVRPLSDVLKEERIPESEIKSIKNNKYYFSIEFNRKAKGKKFIKVNKTKKSKINWRF